MGKKTTKKKMEEKKRKKKLYESSLRENRNKAIRNKENIRNENEKMIIMIRKRKRFKHERIQSNA